MPRPRLRRRARSACLFLHHARRYPLGDRATIALLLQRSAQLRSETASRSRARAARSLRAAHTTVFESDLPFGGEISRAHAARSGLEKISKRRSALSRGRTGMSQPDGYYKKHDVQYP